MGFFKKTGVEKFEAAKRRIEEAREEEGRLHKDQYTNGSDMSGRNWSEGYSNWGDAKENVNQAYRNIEKLYSNQQDEAIKLNKRYDTLVSQLGKDAKAVYDFEKKYLGMHGKNKNRGLEASTIAASILGLVGGAFFLSANMTGNAIADYSTQTVSMAGILLFVIAIIFAFMWLRLKRKRRITSNVSKKRK